MRLPFFIAWRYLFTKQREPLEWFTTAVSLLGVAIGVGTMIAVVGVIDGIKGRVVGEILSSISQLYITNPEWSSAEPGPAVYAAIKADPEVVRAEPILRIWGYMTIGSGKTRFGEGLLLWGVDRLGSDNMWGLRVDGGAPVPIHKGEILVSDKLTTVSLTGREATIMAGDRLKNSIYPVYPTLNFKVRGTFGGGDREVQQRWAFISRDDMRHFTRHPNGITYIHVALHDPMAANEVKARLIKSMPPRTQIETWTDGYERMFSAMRIMKAGMLLVMLMTIVVAALNIIGTLTLIIIQKTSDIGILKAMGATDRMIGRIFMLEGLIIGGVGALMGGAMGVGFLLLVQQFHIQMPAELFEMKTIPVEMHTLTMAALMASALVICTFAAMLPARHAAKLRPVVALRYD